MTSMNDEWDSATWEQAMEIVARRLASFRLGLDAENPYAYNDDEKLRAGIIVGSLSAAGVLNDHRRTDPGQ